MQGYFIANNRIPKLDIIVAWAQGAQILRSLIDTGFTGALAVPTNIARELGLQVKGIEDVTYGDGSIKPTPTALAVAVLADGTKKVVNVLITEGSPAIGVQFLMDYELKMNFKYYTIDLERSI